MNLTWLDAILILIAVLAGILIGMLAATFKQKDKP